MIPVNGKKYSKFEIKFKMADFLLGLGHVGLGMSRAYQISYIEVKRTTRAASEKLCRGRYGAILQHTIL